MEIEFNSLEELYNRIKPALRCKCSELKKLGYPDVKEIDIWNYLSGSKWKNSHNLDLNEMVSDIFNLSGEDIYNYLIKN